MQKLLDLKAQLEQKKFETTFKAIEDAVAAEELAAGSDSKEKPVVNDG
jgi:hypothetical protein